MSISMTQPSMPSQLAQRFSDYIDSEQAVAFGIAVLFHLFVATLLFSHWQQTQLPEPKVKTIKVQMLVQPFQSQSAPPAVNPPQTPQQVFKPVELAKIVSDAKFAKKRVDEKEKPAQLNVTEQSIPIDLSEPLSQSTANLESNNITEKSETANSNENATEANSNPNTEAAIGLPSGNNFDVSQYAPVSKEAPVYPQRALDKGVQGSCTVQYTVNTQGLVEDAKALGDCHAFFIKSSLEATKTFRYTPRLVDGKAVKVPNVKNTFQYRIE